MLHRLFQLGITGQIILLASGCSAQLDADPAAEQRWLAGDHHTHSHYSVSYNEEIPPAWSIGGDGIYPIPMNALMARYHGLDWMVATDHGGPNHSKINFERAYPELQLSRAAVPEVIQFFGLELNTPGADHSSIIVHTRMQKRRCCGRLSRALTPTRSGTNKSACNVTRKRK